VAARGENGAAFFVHRFRSLGFFCGFGAADLFFADADD